MLINPSVLFLDEPTSGIDSTAAQRIMSTLWDLANGGRTVVMTIHQPSSRLFYMFHKVLLLSEGNTVYYGKGEEAMDYFSSIEYAPSVTMNPSDFLLDLANGIVSGDSGEDQSTPKQSLISDFKRNKAENIKAEMQQSSNGHMQNVPEDKKVARWSTSWWQQFTVLLSRALKEMKHESFSALMIGEVLVVSFLTGLLWWKSDIAHIQDEVSYLLLQSILTLKLCQISTYLVLPTVFVIITYWMAGLKPTSKNFFLTLLSLLYNVLVSQGIGLAIGVLVMDKKSATVLESIIMLSFLLAGGYYVQHVPAFISYKRNVLYLPIKFAVKIYIYIEGYSS